MDFQAFVYHQITARLAQFPRLHRIVRIIYHKCYSETSLNPAFRLSQSLVIAQQQLLANRLLDITITKKFVWTQINDRKFGSLYVPYDPISRTGYYPYSKKMTSFADEQLFVALHKICKKEPTVIFDVGANIGVTAIGFSSIFPKALLFAYEPVPTTFAILAATIEKNKLEKISVFQCAIGERVGTVRMTSDLNTGNYVVRGHEKETVSVPLTTIDEQTRKLSKMPELIKIDVEGHEWSVLQGAKRTLQLHHPTLVLELYSPWLRRSGSTAQQIVTFLQQLGYTYYCADTATYASDSLASDLKKNLNFVFYAKLQKNQ